MGYRKEIYEKALKIKADSLKAANKAYEDALQRLRDRDKEFADIEGTLSRAGSSIALAAIAGDEARLAELKAFCGSLNEKKEAILKKNSIKKPSASCALCKDTGYSGGRLCKCVLDIAKGLAFEEMSKSLPLGECRFDNFDLKYYSEAPDGEGVIPRKRATAILNLCKQFAENFDLSSRSLLFIGSAGLGKTHLSLAIVSAVSAKGFGVVYGSAQNLFSAAEKEHFSFSGETTAEDALLDCDLLVIDDLGTEFYSSYAASLFYNIINTRILNKKPTVINTNLNFDELEKRYTPRITSRFIGNYDMKKFVGSDIRQIKALENK